MCNVLNLFKIICAKHHMRAICDENIQNLKRISSQCSLWWHIRITTSIGTILEWKHVLTNSGTFMQTCKHGCDQFCRNNLWEYWTPIYIYKQWNLEGKKRKFVHFTQSGQKICTLNDHAPNPRSYFNKRLPPLPI